MSLVRRVSPSGRLCSSSSWNTKICVYVKLSRSLRNSSSCSVNFWMICWTGTPGGSLVICEGVSCPEAFFFAGSTGGPDGASVLGGGGVNRPDCWPEHVCAITTHLVLKRAWPLLPFQSFCVLM